MSRGIHHNLAANGWHGQAAGFRPPPQGVGDPAFTLVEMIVVIAVILLILGITLPAITALWDERKLSESENTIQGLLMTTRAKSLQAEGVDSGLFFFVDRDGVQRIVSIEQVIPEVINDLIVYKDVFKITPDRDQTLPPPIRVAPRYVVDNTGVGWQVYSATELANNDYYVDNPPPDMQRAQRHRNYFTIVYSGDGQLRNWRDVLIQDADEDKDGFGDVTGRDVGVDKDTPEVAEYWTWEDAREKLDPTVFNRTVDRLLTDRNGVAINFLSVDGLLVYDESLFSEAGDAKLKQDFLLRTAQPFYINRWTGSIIRGPLGENVALP